MRGDEVSMSLSSGRPTINEKVSFNFDGRTSLNQDGGPTEEQD